MYLCSYYSIKMKKSRFIGCIIFIFITTFSFSQEVKEESRLKFQEYFFEALKQKAIQNYDKAIESLEKCYAIDSKNTALLFEFSKNYTYQREYGKALMFIEKALEKAPANLFLLLHKVEIHKKQKEYKQAAEILEKLVDKYPRYNDDLGWLYLKQKKYKKLQELIKKAEAKAYTSQRLYHYGIYLKNRLHVSSATSKKEESNEKEDIKSLKKAFEQKKDYQILYKLLQKEEEQKKYQLLYEDSKNGLDLFPVQAFLYAMNGKALNNLGKFSEAVSILSRGIDFVIDNKELKSIFYKQLATAYYGLKQTEKAKKYQQKAKQ